MTFTFAQPFDNIARVRINIGDVDSTRAIFSDEVINAAITEAGTWQSAVIMLIQSIIAQLSSQPTMRADWLQVDYQTALDSWQKLLPIKARQLGVASGQITATAQYIWRPDSDQTAEPTYPDDGPGGQLPNLIG